MKTTQLAAKNPTIQETPYAPPVRPHIPRHPTLAECEEAGRSPANYFISPAKHGLPLPSPQERARFEAFMHGHEWSAGNFIEADGLYDTMFVRDLFGVWCARGGLPTVWTDD